MRGASSDPRKTLSNKAGTPRGSQWSGLLFSELRHCWGEIREFLNTAKGKEKGADLKSKHPPNHPPTPKTTINRLWLVCFNGVAEIKQHFVGQVSLFGVDLRRHC